ncbi:hypothetical protein [Thermococcus sp.]
MGVSGPVVFAVLLISTIVSFGMLYASGESVYSMFHKASLEYNAMQLKLHTAELKLMNYSYQTLPNLTVYDISFNITNTGSTLSPVKWAYIYDGEIGSTSVVGPTLKYVLPGDNVVVTVQNVLKVANVTHSLVVSTEVGCGLKIKWEWVGNSTNGWPRVIGSAWYCPVEG